MVKPRGAAVFERNRTLQRLALLYSYVNIIYENLVADSTREIRGFGRDKLKAISPDSGTKFIERA